MKRLLLVRHAKASRDIPTQPDRERPLTERGKRQLATISTRLAKRKVKPDAIISSPAVRTRATARFIAKKLDYKRRNIRLDERLYACQAEDLLQIIQSLDDRLQCVMLVGHNPALSELAHQLCERLTHLPTGASAEFSFAVPAWSQIGKTTPMQVVFDDPNKS